MRRVETGGQPEPADWFSRAIAEMPRISRLRLAGVELNLLYWGSAGNAPLLFLHGGAAHAGWWRHIAPFFATERRCIALDFSGHGDSEHRPAYPPQVWVDEVIEAVSDAGVMPDPPVIVGHSMGGLVGIRAAARLGDAITGLVIVDAAARLPEQQPQGRRAHRNLLGVERRYTSREEALRRFRLLPQQPVAQRAIVDFIAGQSVREAAGGWCWKYDARAFADRRPQPVFDELARVSCPCLLLRGEHSRVLDPVTARAMLARVSVPATLVEIPAAHHHVLVDQPLALIAALRTQLRCWGC